MAGLVPPIHVMNWSKQHVDARVKPGHDKERELTDHGVIVIGEKSTNQLFGCTKPLIFGLMARGATSCAT
jgi:hypothetical protein